MAAADFTVLEHTEYEAYVDFFRAAPLDIRTTYELAILDAGPRSASVVAGCKVGEVSLIEKIVRRSFGPLCWMPQYPPAAAPGHQPAPL